jgi:phosphatidylserine/phosphatidylglycerophosphate/cardiolipin synthase-like enzyme
VFSLTDNETARVLSDAYKRGLDVRIITDNDQMDPERGADVCRLHDRWGIPFKYDNRQVHLVERFVCV